MNFEDLLDMLDDTLDKSWSFPLTGGKCVVDVEELRDTIQEMRLNLPQELRQAKAIISERTEVIAAARKEANTIIKLAEERAKQLLANEEIVKQAQAKANEILSSAQTRSKEIKTIAYEYTDSVLCKADECLVQLTSQVRQAKQGLKRPASTTKKT